MSQADIFITPKIADPSNPEGVIGSYYDEDAKKEIRGIELIDIIAQVKQFPNATSLLFHCEGPGGLVDVGNSIYDYMESLKAQGIIVDTITDGDIGSILTKPFLSGMTRTILDGHNLFIHNPWNQPQPGDARSQEFELSMLKQTEAQLRAFYQQHTKITDVGLKGLMDKQTSMNADQAVALGFATQKIGNKIKAFALLKPNSNMSKEKVTTETLAKKIGDFIKEITGIKAEMPGVALPAKAADSPLLGKAVMIDGVAAPDGAYTVVGGMVTAVEPVSEEQNEPAPGGGTAQPGNPNPAAGAQPNALEAKVTALELANKAQAEELASLKAIDVNAAIEKALGDFKNTLTAGSGKGPVKNINNNGYGQPAVPVYKDMAMRLKEIAER